MARAPIIISNGGVITELAKNCAKKTQEDVEKEIKTNVARITEIGNNNKCDSEVVLIKNAGDKAFCLYWRLTKGVDTPYNESLKKYGFNDPRMQGVEKITINQIMDNDV